MSAVDAIAVLDFGSQYTQLIARRIRELAVYSEILPPTVPRRGSPARRLQGHHPLRGALQRLRSGGPVALARALRRGSPRPRHLLRHAGDGVSPGRSRGAHRAARVRQGGASSCARPSKLLRGVTPDRDDRLTVWMSHGDTVLAPPAGFAVLGTTDNCPVAAMADDERRLYAVQFHPEVAHTPQGLRILENFLDICGVPRSWSMASFIDTTVAEIRARVGRDRVLCALSGGVDSSVVAVLVHRAIGDRLTCVFVDNGLLRQGEAEAVVHTFRDTFKINLVHADGGAALSGRGFAGWSIPRRSASASAASSSPCSRRKRQRLGAIPWLAQGTLYPDVIESVSAKGPSATIKTHHNVGGLPERMSFRLIEPLRELFKDEVRRVGELLGLPRGHRLAPALSRARAWPSASSARSPRNGSGCSGRPTPSSRRRCASAGLERDLWQAFAVLLPVHTVGVMGDFRTYGQVIAVRAVTSQDAMTADWARLPYELLGAISNRIMNEVHGHQPRRLRRLVEAAQHHRVGVRSRAARRIRPPPRALRVQPPGRGGPAREARPEGQGPELPGPRPHRPRQPLRGPRLLPRRAEGRHQAHPRLRAVRGPGRTEGPGVAGRRLRGRQPPHRARPQRGRDTATSSSSSPRPTSRASTTSRAWTRSCSPPTPRACSCCRGA